MSSSGAALSHLPIAAGASSALEAVSRPLLRLVQHITGMETSFITAIDWDAQQQDVLFSLNTGGLQVAERSTTDWNDSMCRTMFLAGQAASSDVGGDVVATRNAVAAGMKSFVAVPILAGENAIGTVCGASRSQVRLRDDQIDALQCIADALQQLLQAEHEKTVALARATMAEQHARQARDSALAERGILDVTRHQHGLPAFLFHPSRRLAGVLVFVEIEDGDVRAFAREQHRDRAAEVDVTYLRCAHGSKCQTLVWRSARRCRCTSRHGER